MKLQDINQKVSQESRVFGIVLEHDVEYLLHTKLKVSRADLEPQEWQELIDQCNAKIVEYMKNEKIFDAIKKRPAVSWLKGLLENALSQLKGATAMAIKD